MVELDAVVKGLNFALAWQLKAIELLTYLTTVFCCISESFRKVETKNKSS